MIYFKIVCLWFKFVLGTNVKATFYSIIYYMLVVMMFICFIVKQGHWNSLSQCHLISISSTISSSGTISSSVSVGLLSAHLLGKAELNVVADILNLHGCTLVQLLGHILEFSHIDASLFRQVLTGNLGQADGLGDTGLNGLGVGHINGELHWFKDRDGVTGLLGNLLTDIVFIALSISMSVTLSVTISITMSVAFAVAMSIARTIAGSSDIAGGYHDGITYLCGGDFDVLGWQSL